jgi:8-oxo-dGTP pyrophosphatase MutT (NUDIX family)
MSKQCTKPIVSYGYIAFRTGRPWNQAEDILAGEDAIQQDVQYLLIQRRDSIGFVDFMRGKYKVTDLDYIRTQVEGMTLNERERLVHRPFDELWDNLWGLPQEGFHAYRNEREQARTKLEFVRAASPSLMEIVQSTPLLYTTPEWGFPKGRRDMYESEYTCAIREFYEETNLREADIYPIKNLEPLSERFTGSNSIQYCHKYFLAYVPSRTAETVSMVPESVNPHMTREIGDIRWCSLEEALTLIRPTNTEKKNVLLRVDSLLKKYYPVMLGSRSTRLTYV